MDKMRANGPKSIGRSVVICGGVGAVAGFTAAAFVWRGRRPSLGPQLSTATPPGQGRPGSPNPAADMTAPPSKNGGSTADGFAPGYRGPSKAEIDNLKDPGERNYTRGYSTAVFAARGIVIDLPYGAEERYYADPFRRGYDDGASAAKPAYSNSALEISYGAAVRYAGQLHARG